MPVVPPGQGDALQPVASLAWSPRERSFGDRTERADAGPLGGSRDEILLRAFAAPRLRVRGELYADDVRAKRIRLHAGARAVVLTVPRDALLERHPNAEVKGFFADLDEAKAVDSMRRLHGAVEAAAPLLPT